MSEPLATLSAIIYSARVDRDGAWRLTLEIPPSDGPKVAAMALHTETVFKVDFHAEEKAE